MPRQPRLKKQDQFGKGKVTPVQIAYIVDQYLSENLFTETRSSFRSEASSLISKTPLQQVPKGLMSLETIIEEYVSMKEQKMAVDTEKSKFEQERLRVQTLLQGMQSVMNAYNASSNTVVAAAAGGGGFVPALAHTTLSANASPAGQIVNVTPNARQPWVSSNMMNHAPSNFTTPMITNPSKKRQCSNAVVPGAPVNAKKSRSRMPNKQSLDGSTQPGVEQQSAFQSSTSDCVADITSAHVSSVANVLFHKSTMMTTTTTTCKSTVQNSSSPATPPRALSTQSDKNASPAGRSSSTNSSNKSTTPPNFSSNCVLVSTKKVIVSPGKKETYYSMEKHCSSTSSPAKGEFGKFTRDRVKGRLNFDGIDEMKKLENSTVDESSTSESDDANIFNLDMPNLDFNISDLLLDFDLNSQELDDSSHQPVINPCSVETVSSGDHMLPETSSTITTRVFSSTTDTCTGIKLVSNSVEIPSPEKHSSSIQEKLHP